MTTTDTTPTPVYPTPDPAAAVAYAIENVSGAVVADVLAIPDPGLPAGGILYRVRFAAMGRDWRSWIVMIYGRPAANASTQAAAVAEAAHVARIAPHQFPPPAPTPAPTTGARVTITGATFRRVIGDLLAAHDVASFGDMFADRGAIAAAFVDRVRAAADMVEDEAIFAASAGGDMLPGEVVTILDTADGDPTAFRPFAVVDAVRDAIRREAPDDDDDRCARHGAGPTPDGDGVHQGYAGPIYVTRYACGCTTADMSDDVPER